MTDPSNETLADQLNEVGAQIQFERGSNKEILTIPAFVNFNTVSLGDRMASWSNEEKKWVPG